VRLQALDVVGDAAESGKVPGTDLREGVPTLPPAVSRRHGTVYACPNCQTRYLGQQRCEDCNTFASRLGPGGSCPDCDTLITFDELLAGT
jgi:predicted RNA-binding Zn-ribbon protein involved in translation (DUF1610 family)